MLDNFQVIGQHIAIVLEPLAKNLFDFTSNSQENDPYSMEIIEFITYQLCTGLNAVHELKIIHADIATRNVWLVDSTVITRNVPSYDYLTKVRTVEEFNKKMQ